MSLADRMAKAVRKRFAQSAELVEARCEDGWSWSVRVRGVTVLEARDKSKRAARLLLHDALSGLARAADSRVGKNRRKSSPFNPLATHANDNAYEVPSC